MKNDISDDRIVFKSLSDLYKYKDTFQHFRDGMTEEASKLLANHNKQETQAHREDMAILYDNVPILNQGRFRYGRCGASTPIGDEVKEMAITSSYAGLYNEMVDEFDNLLKSTNADVIYRSVENIIRLKNIVNFKMAIENIGIRGEEYAKTKFVPIPES